VSGVIRGILRIYAEIAILSITALCARFYHPAVCRKPSIEFFARSASTQLPLSWKNTVAVVPQSKINQSIAGEYTTAMKPIN
jgi:hypothetical protein